LTIFLYGIRTTSSPGAIFSLFHVTVVTQNVDNLHERAGSSNIIHLHGELTKVRPVDCYTDQDSYSEKYVGDDNQSLMVAFHPSAGRTKKSGDKTATAQHSDIQCWSS